MCKVTAIVSTYNAERLIEGRLRNLFATTTWRRGELDVVVVDSGSRQDECRIIERLRAELSDAENDRLIYVRTKREPLYCAWNRAIKIARGEYLTNANTDDRIAPDAIDALTDAIENYRKHDESVIGAYGDCIVTSTENAQWMGDFRIQRSANYPNGVQNWADAHPSVLVERCVVGNCPVWLKAAHDKAGLFDESYTLAGDYEMWLRFAQYGMRFKKVSRIVGLFYESDRQLSNVGLDVMRFETMRAILKHRDEVLRVWT